MDAKASQLGSEVQNGGGNTEGCAGDRWTGRTKKVVVIAVWTEDPT